MEKLSKIEYEEHQQRVMVLRESAEAKLQTWKEKLGQQEEVEQLLEDYRDFVDARQLFNCYSLLSTQLEKKAKIWRKAAGKEGEQQVVEFLKEERTQWKIVSEDIKNVLPKLEGALENWKQYNASIESLTAFINEGESVMSRSNEEKQQHFSEIPVYQEKLQQVNDSGNYLIKVCREPVAEEIEQTLALLNTEFKNVTESFEEFKRVEIIGKGRQEYAEGVERLSEWLKNAEELMMQPIPCIHSNLKDHLQDMSMCGNQIPEMENDFKTTTKIAQALVKDSGQEVVNEMLQTINIQKEIIVRVRKEVPERIKYLKAVLPNVESLETGISDLNIWLDKGEKILSTNKMEGSQKGAEERLEQHKAFFRETTYQKSILESKNEVHQKVASTKPKLVNLDFTPADDPMSAVNQRFQECVECAKDWEKKLENLCRLWRVYQQKEAVLDSWLQQARTVLDDQADDPETCIRKHRKFFEKLDDNLKDEILKTGQDIVSVLKKSDQDEIQQRLSDIIGRWEKLRSELKDQLSYLTTHERQCEQVTQHASPERAKALKSNLDVKALNATVRQAVLSNDVKHRQNFCAQLLDFQKWLKKSYRELYFCNEISKGNIHGMQSKLKDLKEEGNAHEPMFRQLTHEYKDLIQNSPEEADILKNCYSNLMASYTKLDDLMKNREELCENWKYSADYNLHSEQQNLEAVSNRVESEDEFEDNPLRAQYLSECDICENPVSFTCKRCVINFCTTCVVPHMLTKSKKNHDVVRYNDLNKVEGGTCLAHPQQQCSAFCKTCDIPICLLCVLIEHETHQTSDLSEKVDELSNFITKRKDHLQSIQSDFEKIHHHTSKRLKALPQVYQQSKDNVASRARECHHEIDKTEEILHANLDIMQERNTALVLTQKEEIEKILKKFKSLRQSVLSLEKSKDFFLLKELSLELENLQVPSSVEEIRPAYFQPCKLDENYITTYFGYTETLKSFKLSIDDMKSEDTVQSPRQALYVPTVLFTFDTEFPCNEQGNRLLSIVSLGDDRVWTGGYSNELKLFDLQGLLLDTVTISALGYYLTLLDEHIVYSDPEDNTVRNITNRKVNTLFHTGKWIPKGIASTAAGNLLICLITLEEKESKVVRYSSSGDVLQEIQYDSQYQPLFKFPVSVVENGNYDICVADWDKGALIVVDKYGIFRFSYSGNKAPKYKFHATSLTTDSMHHIIITDAYNDKIHMLDRDGRFLRYIIPDKGIGVPFAVCVVKEGELMVGENIKGWIKRIKYL